MCVEYVECIEAFGKFILGDFYVIHKETITGYLLNSVDSKSHIRVFGLKGIFKKVTNETVYAQLNELNIVNDVVNQELTGRMETGI